MKRALFAWLLLSLTLPTGVMQAQETLDAGATLEPHQLSSLLDSAVAKLAAAARADAQRFLEQKRYQDALAALETARELEPLDLTSLRKLADLEVQLGHTERAERLYRELIELAPDRGDTYLALGDLLARDRDRPERLNEAGALYAKAQERLGAEPAIVLRKARLAAARGSFAEAERAYQQLLRGRLDDALALELGDFYRDAGRADDALQYYRQVSGAQTTVAAQRVFELEVDKEARRYGLSRRDRSLDPQLASLRQQARFLVGQRKLAEAEAMLRDGVARAPERAELHAELADVLLAAGRTDAAELEFLRAIALDGSQPEVYVRLSELYLASQHTRATEAAWLLERALAARPDWVRPHLLLARAYREQGDLPRALSHVSRFVAQASPGLERDDAIALQASLQVALGVEAPQPSAASTPDGPARGADHLARARTFLAGGQTEAALAELRRLEGSASLRDQAIDLQARVLYAAGRLPEATALLEGRADQPELRELLGEVWLARRDPERARRAFLECEAAGRASCSYRLARLDSARSGAWGALADLGRVRPLWQARERYAKLEGQPGLPLTAAEIARLRGDVDARLWALAGLAAGFLLLVAGLALAARRARWGGLDLAQLLSQHPQAAPEVQRVLSAIRHEVLKHNTLMLAGVAQTLQGPDGGGEEAAHIARALVGPDGRGGAAAKLEDYADKLAQIGRAHGERLNLRRRDAALSALQAGFALVRGARAQLTATERLPPRARRKLAKRLAEANELLNVQGQNELRTLLDGMRNLRLTAPLLAALFDRVRSEPALSSAPIEPLALDPESELPCSVAVPTQAFDDILANLFRNALQASLRYPQPRPVIVGLRVHRQIDDITGLATAELRVRDRAPEVLDPEKLRFGYIEAGLGLTADLVARHEGQLSVHAPEPGFEKAVVLRLPVQRSEAP